MDKQILILLGGGGHTGFGISLAEYLKDKIELFFLVPEDDPLSYDIAIKYGKTEKTVKPRHPRTPFLRFIFRFIKATLLAYKKVDKKYDYVVSTGSNFCIPPSIIAWLKNIPIINIEGGNKLAGPSKTAKYLKRISKLTVLQWEEQEAFLGGKMFGPFLPPKRVDIADKGHILISGGTYGYLELIEAAINLPYKNVALQTGRINPEPYKNKQQEWKIFGNTPDFLEYIASSEIVITPPGSTAFEALTYGKKVIIIKYPEWSKAGNQRDAELFARKLNAPYIDEINTVNMISAIKKVQTVNMTELQNGAKKLANYIIENNEESITKLE